MNPQQFMSILADYARQRAKAGVYDFLYNETSPPEEKRHGVPGIFGVNTADFGNTLAAEFVGIHIEIDDRKKYKTINNQ